MFNFLYLLGEWSASWHMKSRHNFQVMWTQWRYRLPSSDRDTMSGHMNTMALFMNLGLWISHWQYGLLVKQYGHLSNVIWISYFDDMELFVQACGSPGLTVRTMWFDCKDFLIWRHLGGFHYKIQSWQMKKGLIIIWLKQWLLSAWTALHDDQSLCITLSKW